MTLLYTSRTLFIAFLDTSRTFLLGSYDAPPMTPNVTLTTVRFVLGTIFTIVITRLLLLLLLLLLLIVVLFRRAKRRQTSEDTFWRFLLAG